MLKMSITVAKITYTQLVSTNESSTNTDFHYEFFIRVPAHSDMYGLSLFNIRINERYVTNSEIEFHVTPLSGDVLDICKAQESVDTQVNFAVIQPNTKVFTIVTEERIEHLDIMYHRPMYAPGWEILKDGIVFLSEDSNRGSSSTPDQITYHYHADHDFLHEERGHFI